MINQEVELLIPINQFLGVLNLCDDHCKEKREVFKTADALRIQEGTEFFSVIEYAKYVQNQIDSSWEDLVYKKSPSAFTDAELETREFLWEWTRILTWLLSTAAIIDTEKKDQFDEGFKMAIADFQRIFEKLRSIFEFTYDLAFAGQISGADKNTSSPK